MKRTLKEIAATITVNFVRIGFNPETEQTDFIAIINHERFEFHCGLMACIPASKMVNGVHPLDHLASYYKLSFHIYNFKRVYDMIRLGKLHAMQNVDVPHVMRVFNDISALCAPTAYDVLYSLRLDGEGADANMTFRQWCAEFGYDTDSISARNIYDECQVNHEKLKKALGQILCEELMECEDID